MEYLPAKHLLHRSRDTRWFGTDHTMNIYRGCCHGCLYCDSRSACYQNPDFDTVKAKADALRILTEGFAGHFKALVFGEHGGFSFSIRMGLLRMNSPTKC